MDRLVQLSLVVFVSIVSMTTMTFAQTATQTESAAAEDPNDKSQQERSFDETRKHMQSHSEWSKKTGKMNDN